MAVNFSQAFAHVVGVEGRYANDPRDSGGETMYGITERVARAHGYTGAMKSMPLSVAEKIYKKSYWDILRLDDVAAVSYKLALELFDSCVNCGATRAATWLQAALNALNDRGTIYGDIPLDGQVGRLTIAALQALVQRRGTKNTELAVGRLCDCQQGAYYLELSQRRQKDEAFIFGWVMNRTGGW